MKTQTCKSNADNHPFQVMSRLCQMIYKASKIVINCLKCGKNMDLLTIEILTITQDSWLKFILRCSDFLIGIVNEAEL